MTNREKFKEVFGIEVKWSDALSPQIAALRSIQLEGISCAEEWLNAEYDPRKSAGGDLLRRLNAAIELFEDNNTVIDTHLDYTEEEEVAAVCTAIDALHAIKTAYMQADVVGWLKDYSTIGKCSPNEARIHTSI